MPTTADTLVWLLRHGTSTFNLQHRCQGCSDEPELTPQAREEARLSAERLASKGIQAVITSPLRRASGTARELLKVICQKNARITFETDARLREVELYQWEGLSLKEIPHRFPEQYHEWRLRPDTFHMSMTDTEVQYPLRNLYGRVRSFWNYLLTAHSGKSVLLVTHSGTIRALITSALGLGPEHFHCFQQSNCGLSRLRFSSGLRAAKLELLNDTAHLGEQLPKFKEGKHGLRLLFVSVTEIDPVAIRSLAAALHGVVIEHTLAVGSTARDVASRLFSSHCYSCLVVSEATADSVADQLFQQCCGDQLRNVAILGSPAVLRGILQQQLRISDAAAESLDLHPFEISPVHRPGNGVPPVLQSMNISKPSPAFVGV